jgi:hypothetical protein
MGLDAAAQFTNRNAAANAVYERRRYDDSNSVRYQRGFRINRRTHSSRLTVHLSPAPAPTYKLSEAG